MCATCNAEKRRIDVASIQFMHGWMPNKMNHITIHKNRVVSKKQVIRRTKLSHKKKHRIKNSRKIQGNFKYCTQRNIWRRIKEEIISIVLLAQLSMRT